jgi:hypothetical protein
VAGGARAAIGGTCSAWCSPIHWTGRRGSSSSPRPEGNPLASSLPNTATIASGHGYD